MVWRLGFAGFVRGGQDVGDVGGQQVVHLVAQGGLEHQLGVGGGVSDTIGYITPPYTGLLYERESLLNENDM